MDNSIVITLKDIGMITLWALGCGVLIFMILILKRLYDMVKMINQTLKDNRPHIDRTLQEVPEITQNVSSISGEVAHIMQAFHGTIDNVAETSESVTSVMKDHQGLIDTFSSFFNVLSKAKSLYTHYFGTATQEEPTDFDRP